MIGDEEAAVTGNSHMVSGIGVGSATAQGSGDGFAQKKDESADDHKKEKSVLQAKLTKLAIQIGYAGIHCQRLFFFFLFCIIFFFFKHC